MIFSSNKIIKIIKKNIEITFLFLLLLITISSTNIYNEKKVLIDENYKNLINNIYFQKSINQIFDNLVPRHKNIDHSLGRPLPYQQTNQVRAHPMVHKAFSVKTYPVLAQVSSCYSRPKGRYPHVTHPSATKYCYFVRLACVRRAASVRSEP